MTEPETRRLLLALQVNKGLRGACVVVIEGSYPRVLLSHHGTGPWTWLAVYKLDAMNRGWSEPVWRQNVQLQLRKLGVRLTDLGSPWVFGGEYACFPCVAGPERTPGLGVNARAASPGQSQTALVQTTDWIPVAQMSSNAQYPQVQSSMQRENSQFTAVSNIMKTKHDTVKNSISNVR